MRDFGFSEGGLVVFQEVDWLMMIPSSGAEVESHSHAINDMIT